MDKTNKTYCKIDSKSLINVSYAYIDTAEHLADQLFIMHKARVSFKDEYRKDNTPYVVVFCKLKKKNESRFLEALAELGNKMLLLGHSDYFDFCKQFFERAGMAASKC